MKFTEPSQWHIGMAAALLAGMAVVAWSCTWFASEPPPAVLSTDTLRSASPTHGPATSSPLSPDLWAKVVWGIPAPAKTATAATSTKPARAIKLVAIMPRGGRLTACMQVNATAPPIFLSVGDTRDGIEVRSVERTHVEVIVDGQPQRLVVRP